jgi:hypothetical protein
VWAYWWQAEIDKKEVPQRYSQRIGGRPLGIRPAGNDLFLRIDRVSHLRLCAGNHQSGEGPTAHRFYHSLLQQESEDCGTPINASTICGRLAEGCAVRRALWVREARQSVSVNC